MAELSIGATVSLKTGGSAKVLKKLGEGGQGIVYDVESNGKHYALKWYMNNPSDAFFENLDRNIKKGAPSDAFLWPEALTNKQNGSFGYLMKLRPQEYKDFGDFLLAKAKFAGVDKVIEAALQICTGFQKLHAFGLSYQDLNDGNFFINPQTGKVLICDNDNVTANGVKSGILGKCRYMAPEIVAGEKAPDRYTDYFSLAVVLFLLFYMNHPLEGQRVLSCPCMTEDADRKLFGKECVFIMDPNDASNRPVRGQHTNVIRRWPLFPKLLAQTFQTAFSKEAIANPVKRPMDIHWQKILVQLRDSLVTCPHCGKKTFVDFEQPASTCLECGKAIPKPKILKVGEYSIALMPEQKIYKCHVSIEPDFNTEAGEIIKNAKNPSLFGIRNLSDVQWSITTPSGEVKLVNRGDVMPALPGLKITFKSGIKGEII